MSNYKNQEFDFIQRTKSIIEQYDNFQIAEKDKFQVTLLLNCLVGLFILPQQHWFDNVPRELISKKEWELTNFTYRLFRRQKLRMLRTLQDILEIQYRIIDSKYLETVMKK